MLGQPNKFCSSPERRIVDQGTGGFGHLAIDAVSTGIKIPAIANAAMIRNILLIGGGG
jgi:hypothetical protein